MLLFSPLRSSPFRGLGEGPSFSFAAKCRTFPDTQKNNRHSLHQQAKKSYLRRLEVTTCSTGGGERIRILPSPICMRGMHYPPPLQNRPQCIPPPFFFPHVVATDLLLPQKYAPILLPHNGGKLRRRRRTPPVEKKRGKGMGHKVLISPNSVFVPLK